MADFSKGAAWMRGEIIPISEAAIPVNDWGLTRSDCVYDVAGVNSGAFFRLEDHVKRFQASIENIRLSVTQTSGDIREILHAIVAHSGLQDAYVAMVASRGVPMVPGSRDPRDCANHFFAWCVPYVHVIKPEVAARGARLYVPQDIHRIAPTSIDPTAKNYHWGDMTRGLLEAVEKGFDSAVLTDQAGNVTEGPGFNVFAVFGDRLVTSDHGVLKGVTRQSVIEIALEKGMVVEQRTLPLEEFFQADEIFTATTGGGVAPVVRVNGHIFSNDAPGEKTLELAAIYRTWLQRPELRDVVAYGAC